jgi:hypothetical protein
LVSKYLKDNVQFDEEGIDLYDEYAELVGSMVIEENSLIFYVSCVVEPVCRLDMLKATHEDIERAFHETFKRNAAALLKEEHR